MLNIIRKHRKIVASALGVSLLAGNMIYHPFTTKAESDHPFELTAAWVNSPVAGSDGYPSKTEYQWDAKTEETRNVSFALQYYFDDAQNSGGFAENSIEIHIPGLEGAYREDAEEPEILLPEEYWDLNFDTDTGEYIVTNNRDIDMLTGFAGEIEVSYPMNSRDLISDTELTIAPYVVLDQEQIPSLQKLRFIFHSEKDRYVIQASVKTVDDPTEISGAEELNLVRYEIIETIQNASRGAHDRYYQITELGDARVFGYSDGDVIVTNLSGSASSGYRIPYAPTRQIYIGYPKADTGRKEHTVSLYGTYYDETDVERLAQTETFVDLSDFSFTYEGELYMIGNTGYDTKPEENRISLESLMNGRTVTYSLSAVARNAEIKKKVLAAAVASSANAEKEEYDYDDVASFGNAKRRKRSLSTATSGNAAFEHPKKQMKAIMPDMDVWIINDFMYVQNESGEFRELGTDDYEILSIVIPSNEHFTNENGLAFESGKYTADILVNTFDRNAEAYRSVKIDGTDHKIELPDGTNRIMIRIRGLKESLHLEHGNMWMEVEYHLDPSGSYLPGGFIRNLDSIWVDWNGIEHHNQVDPDTSYPGDAGDVIKNRDKDAYGDYMQRNYFDYYYIDRDIQGLLLMSQQTDDSYPDTGRTDGFITGSDGYETYVNFTSVFTNVDNSAKKWTTYTILPKGMEINHEQPVAFDVQLPSGLSLSRKNMKISEVKNYKRSGRTFVSLTYDFTDQPVSSPNGIIMAALELPVVVSYEAVAKETAYPVWGISMMTLPDENVTATGILEGAYPGQAKGGRDDGSAIAAIGSTEAKLWADINRDGSESDQFVFNNVMLSIRDLAAVNMEIISYVRNEEGEFIPNIDNNQVMTEVKVSPGDPYVYRLNAVNTTTPAKNVVFYDVLEAGELDGETGRWKGILDHVDVAALRVAGLNPEVYYYTGSLPVEEDYTSSGWGKTIPTNKETVKAIAVTTEWNGDVLSENMYVDIHMKAPSEEETKDQNLHGLHTLNRYTLEYATQTGSKRLNSNFTGVTLYETGDILITKKDADTDKPLEGAEFYLLNPDHSVVGGPYTSDKDGKIEINNIPYGEYLLWEKTPPAHYTYVGESSYMPVYLGNNETLPGTDGESHEFVRLLELTIYNKLLEDRSLTITKQVVDSGEEKRFGEISFLYRVEGKDLNGKTHVWSAIITPSDETGYGSVTIDHMPISDENGYRVTEITNSRYQLTGLTGTHTKNDADLSRKTITADLYQYQTSKVEYVNVIKRWDKFGWSSKAINDIDIR